MRKVFTQTIDRTFPPEETFVSPSFTSSAEQLTVTLTGRADAPVTAAVLSNNREGKAEPVFTCRTEPEDGGS